MLKSWAIHDLGFNTAKQSSAYSDLIFSFGLAKLGQGELANDLMLRAQAVLAHLDEVHQFLFAAFKHRISCTLQHLPQSKGLPEQFTSQLTNLPTLAKYPVDKMIASSTILQMHPLGEGNPYSRYEKTHIVTFNNKANEILDHIESKGSSVSRKTFPNLLNMIERERIVSERGRLLARALGQSLKTSRKIAEGLVSQALTYFNSQMTLGSKKDLEEVAVRLLATTAVAITHFKLIPHITPLLDQLCKLLDSPMIGISYSHSLYRNIIVLIENTCRCLCIVGMNKELGELVDHVNNLPLGGKELQSVIKNDGVIVFDEAVRHKIALFLLLSLVSPCYHLGRVAEAEAILARVRSELFRESNRDQYFSSLPWRRDLACLYARVVVESEPDLAKARLEGLFREMPGLCDNFSTSTHYQILQLNVVEAVVLAAVDLAKGQRRR